MFRQLYRLFLSLRSCKEELFPLKFRIPSEKLSRIIRNSTSIVPEGMQQIFLILCPYLLQKVGNKWSLQSFVVIFPEISAFYQNIIKGYFLAYLGIVTCLVLKIVSGEADILHHDAEKEIFTVLFLQVPPQWHKARAHPASLSYNE